MGKKRKIIITESEHDVIKLALRKMAEQELKATSCYSEVQNCISTLEVLANIHNYQELGG
jgi:hypothetical protein